MAAPDPGDAPEVLLLVPSVHANVEAAVAERLTDVAVPLHIAAGLVGPLYSGVGFTKAVT